ncbi:hypothetical protein AAFC00_004459 [Neodothiora populina]|uniref:Major facilitator superfamily transporter n=1 Tax=Neodothiora populina TaxID=2781224 RepID=A0ABR3P231_9PEZI
MAPRGYKNVKGYTSLDGVYVDTAEKPQQKRKERVSDEQEHQAPSYSSHNNSSHDSHDDFQDSPYDGSDDGGYNPSIRRAYDSMDSHKPMLLQRARSASTRKGGVALSYALPRRRFTRYFTLVIATSIIAFIFVLSHASWTERAALAAGNIARPPSKPPAWEEFPFLKRYHGGLRTLIPRSNNKPEYPDPDNNSLSPDPAKAPAEVDKRAPAADAYNPYPNYTSEEYKKEHDPMVKCTLDKEGKISAPRLHVYHGVTEGFPDPVMGSYELFGLDNDVCFERYGRLGPYGYGYSRKWGGSGAGMAGDREGAEEVWGDGLEVDYRAVRWGDAQDRCNEANRFRFKSRPKARNHFFQTMASGGLDKEGPESTSGEKSDPEKSKSGKKLLPRTAVLIRTWWDYDYDYEDLFYLRALVNELSIQSGGEYTIHFLIHVKDDNMQIWSDDETYQRVLNDALPDEFRGMGTLWSERQMGLIYGGVEESFYRDLPVHGAYRSTYMPVQYFAHMHPEYDFFWHWEMDVRYTGHFYHLFDKVSKWAKQQPRKGLWERNSRFYIPSEHGSWDDFKHLVRVQTEHGTAHKSSMYNKIAAGSDPKTVADTAERPEAPVWGPHPPTGPGNELETDMDVIPDTEYAKDDYQWGVGEEADFITFNPLFDPDGTNWILAEDVTGYNTSESFPPRRTAIITASRLSRRLLETMHRETALKRHTMFSEMWPGSCALHHGFKAVYAPHPVYIDRRWPTSYLAAIFNNGRNGAAGGARTSIFSDERQHNFLGTTWYYHAGFPANLWKRWLGYKVDNDGGEEAELAGEGRMCLPAMLLHPVKQVDLIYEHQVGE